MAEVLTCRCGRQCSIPEGYQAKQVRCPSCKQVLDVPDSEPVASPRKPVPSVEELVVAPVRREAAPPSRGRATVKNLIVPMALLAPFFLPIIYAVASDIAYRLAPGESYPSARAPVMPAPLPVSRTHSSRSDTSNAEAEITEGRSDSSQVDYAADHFPRAPAEPNQLPHAARKPRSHFEPPADVIATLPQSDMARNALPRAPVRADKYVVDEVSSKPPDPNDLTGTWKTSSGTQYRLDDDGFVITVGLISSEKLSAASGKLERDGQKLKGAFDLVYEDDPFSRAWNVPLTATVENGRALKVKAQTPVFRGTRKVGARFEDYLWTRVDPAEEDTQSRRRRK